MKRYHLSLIPASIALAIGGVANAQVTNVPTANPRIAGVVAPNILSPELQQIIWASGSMALENPVTNVGFYGYNTAPFIVLPPDTQPSKTEPDKNTYLVLRNQVGPDSHYDYGTHFLFQGHETGSAGYLTRINLDADGAHRVTLMATTDTSGNPLPLIDGSTWYPWAERLLLTGEEYPGVSGVWQATATYPSVVDDLTGIMGKGGFEGIQADSDGNVWIVEDIGGANGTINTKARQPNSFIYRFVPKNKYDLKAGGKLQALAVASKQHGGAIKFTDGNPDADILSNDIRDLHTYGLSFDTSWVTIHDTSVDGFAIFDANALAKTKGATPFKRPENGVFRPGFYFRDFFFTETGDTRNDALAGGGADYGALGGVFKLSQRSPSADTGRLTIFYESDVAHSGFDNIQFWNESKLVVVEDAGERLHGQRNALDSGYIFDVRADYSNAANQPVRFLAQGRDPSAVYDNLTKGSGDNEITGIHVSDGDPTPNGVLGAKIPNPFKDGWRVFYTQQHGDNITYEIIPATGRGDRDH
jgi:hypothetical protein